MTDLWISPDRVFDGQHLRDDMAVRVSDGRVLALGGKSDHKGAQQIQGTVTPGFVDLQVNGGGGVLFNQSPTRAGIKGIIDAHRMAGTVAIMPTLITDGPDAMGQAAQAAIDAQHDPGFAGIHFEGPHIDPVKRGTHAAGFIRPLDDQTITIVSDLRQRGIAVMITLAPEAATLAQIRALAATGAIVSLGHSSASGDAGKAALGAGASCFTHLYNAMSQMQGRDPGLTGTAINSNAYVGIICDGIHVNDDMVGLAIRGRAHPDRMFMVSDAMPTVCGPDHFRLYDSDIRLQDGQLINDEGNLAGAHVTQAQGVARLVQRVGISLQMALRMAIAVPCTLIGNAGLQTLDGRQATDIVVLDDDLQYTQTLAGVIDNHLA